MQEGTWVRLAFCAMELEEWDTAARAYRRYSSLNSDVSFTLDIHSLFFRYNPLYFQFNEITFLVFSRLRPGITLLNATSN